MVESPTVEELEQSIRDAQEKFNVGMGADGDASPYPLLNDNRGHRCCCRPPPTPLTGARPPSALVSV